MRRILVRVSVYRDNERLFVTKRFFLFYVKICRKELLLMYSFYLLSTYSIVKYVELYERMLLIAVRNCLAQLYASLTDYSKQTVVLGLLSGRRIVAG